MRKRILYKIIIIASLIGLIISSYLTYVHYANHDVVCTSNDIKKCNEILDSSYSTLIFNIPNALIGAVGFFMLLILGYLGIKERNVKNLILIFSSIALVFIFYFAYLVFFVIKSFCIWCFTTWILIIIIFVCSLFIKKSRLIS